MTTYNSLNDAIYSCIKNLYLFMKKTTKLDKSKISAYNTVNLQKR